MEKEFIECLMNKEMRRRIKIIDSLPSEESAMKIIYPSIVLLNEKWPPRSLREFYKCRDTMREMLQRGYP